MKTDVQCKLAITTDGLRMIGYKDEVRRRKLKMIYIPAKIIINGNPTKIGIIETQLHCMRNFYVMN